MCQDALRSRETHGTCVEVHAGSQGTRLADRILDVELAECPSVDCSETSLLARVVCPKCPSDHCRRCLLFCEWPPELAGSCADHRGKYNLDASQGMVWGVLALYSGLDFGTRTYWMFDVTELCVEALPRA